MVYKNLNLIIILSLLFLSVNKLVYGQSFIPGPRFGQAAVYIEDRIYYVGGFEEETVPKKSNFFYLEMEEGWVDLTSQGVNLPTKSGHIADIGGTNQDLIFIVGGFVENQNMVYQFDTNTNKLTTPIIQANKGKIPPSRVFTNSVSYKGKIYIFSGLINADMNTFYNGFDILDTINLSWEVGTLEGAPIPRHSYTATLVNGVIYYIGGFQRVGKVREFDPLSNVRKLIIKLIKIYNKYTDEFILFYLFYRFVNLILKQIHGLQRSVKIII
jgi:hypothetical protein